MVQTTFLFKDVGNMIDALHFSAVIAKDPLAAHKFEVLANSLGAMRARLHAGEVSIAELNEDHPGLAALLVEEGVCLRGALNDWFEAWEELSSSMLPPNRLTGMWADEAVHSGYACKESIDESILALNAVIESNVSVHAHA